VTHPRTADALFGFAIKTRRFLAVTGIFAIVVGLADTLLLLWLGIPLALLWGLLAAACNFIPLSDSSSVSSRLRCLPCSAAAGA
jgi:predicted PurR-regulated permease PerM